MSEESGWKPILPKRVLDLITEPLLLKLPTKPTLSGAIPSKLKTHPFILILQNKNIKLSTWLPVYMDVTGPTET